MGFRIFSSHSCRVLNKSSGLAKVENTLDSWPLLSQPSDPRTEPRVGTPDGDGLTARDRNATPACAPAVASSPYVYPDCPSSSDISCVQYGGIVASFHGLRGELGSRCETTDTTSVNPLMEADRMCWTDR